MNQCGRRIGDGEGGGGCTCAAYYKARENVRIDYDYKDESCIAVGTFLGMPLVSTLASYVKSSMA